MNTLIETLNRFGENALHFAWPMLWQSSALIAILFAIDFALRRRIRAAVRYALWLVLLVKLLLPPSLALPTGVAWWLFPAVTTPARPHVTKFVVNYGADTAPSLPLQPIPAFTPPPRPPMSAVAWIILAWSAISVCLLVWLAARWRQTICDVKRATPAPAWLNELFDEAKDSSGLRRNVRLRLTDQAMSPAVCGLFRPVILLPQSLVQKLPPAQLRAVLLHELTHLRRSDVWINCAQALVQIVYWWHPLLWLANARTRSVREEAVDDAVMLALRDEAETYAPTLLEVAKLAFHRPLASLGLVGIMESRSALRQRIERLVNFRAPRKAGLTLVSLCGICVFSAVALPMGEATTSAGKQPVTQAAQPEQSLTVKVNPEVFIKNIKAQANLYLHNTTSDYTDVLLDILRGEGVDCRPPHGLAFNTKTGEITTQNTPEALDVFRQVIEQLNRPDGQCNLLAIPIHRKGVLIQGEFYTMPTADFDELTKGLHLYDDPRFSNLPWWSISPEQFSSFSNHIQSLGLHPLQRPRIQTGHGITAQFYCGTETNHFELSCLPFVTVDETQRFVELTVQANTKGWFTDNPTGDWPVHDGTNRYAVSGQVSAEDHGGIVLRAKNPAGENLVVILGVQIITNDTPALKPASRVDPVLLVRGEKRKNIAAKLDRIRLDQVSWPARLPLSEALRMLSLQTKLCDPDKKGINFTFQTNAPAASAAAASAGGATTINPTTGLPEATAAGVAVDPSSINVKLTLTNMWLGDVLDAIVLAADHPIKYSILDDGIVFATRGSNSAPLETRTFMVDANIFLAALQKQTGLPTNVTAATRQFLSNAGVDLSPPKSIYFNETRGLLLVRATSQDLDAVEKAIPGLNMTPPQIHIKARFIEVPQETLKLLGTNSIPTGTTNATGILTDANFRLLLQTLEQCKGVENLAEPEVTTIIGRQTQMRATESIAVIDGINPQALTPPGVLSTDNTKGMKTVQIETGPAINVFPHLLADGHTIYLEVTASVTEFTGYDEREKTNLATIYVDGRKKQVNVPMPQFTTRELKTNVEFQDNQTVVLGGGISTQITATKETVPVSGDAATGEPRFREQTTRTVGEKKQLLVLITATLVDAAGNRIHRDDEMPIAHPGIPSQDSR
jgi:beta-lactamase regulating signal transducer with metallopeptidase domain/type II secretory pathway component GspD/PulD (secretin)